MAIPVIVHFYQALLLQGGETTNIALTFDCFNNLVWPIISGQGKNVLCQGSFSFLQTVFENLICLEKLVYFGAERSFCVKDWE